MINLIENNNIRYVVYILIILVLGIFVGLFINKLNKNNESKLNKKTNITYSDNNQNCPIWAYNGECLFNPEYMLENCKKSCGMNGIPEELVDTVKKNYLEFIEINSKDNNIKCNELAKRGDCDINPNYMLKECKKSCANNWNRGFLYNQKKLLN